MYVLALECLDLCDGLRFLNVGSGSGYFSALVSYILTKVFGIPQCVFDSESFAQSGVSHGIELKDATVDFAKKKTAEFAAKTPQFASRACETTFIQVCYGT